MSGKKKQFSVRLPDDMATAVEQYADDRGLSQADTLRRAIGSFMRREGYPRDTGKGVIADGGVGTVRSHLRTQSAFTATVGLLALLMPAIGVPFGTPLAYLATAFSAFLITAVLTLVGYTRLPELADAWLAVRVRWAADRLPFGGARA